jgi:SAM-dependent methyltransferase
VRIPFAKRQQSKGPSRQSVLDPGDLLMVQERERHLARIFQRAGFRTLTGVSIFEAGSGGGYNLRQFVQWGANPADLAGIDIDVDRVAYCMEHSPAIKVHIGSAASIPESDGSFDVSVAFTLFSSIHDEEVSAAIGEELYRVTRPGGLILIYDMRRNNPRNSTVHAVARDDIHRWFPKCRVRGRHLTLAPPIARFVAKRVPFLYGPLALIPLLRTHSLYVLRRPASNPFDAPQWDEAIGATRDNS